MSDFTGKYADILRPNLAKLDWLVVDREMYEMSERLPQTNNNIIPDLQDAWTHREFNPNPRVPGQNIHSSSIRDTGPDYEEMGSRVVAHVRKLAMQGYTTEQVRDWASQNIPAQHVAHLTPYLASVVPEIEVLGNVYVDVRDWSLCHQGEGKGTVARSKTAKFALANESKCSDCVNNTAGKCSVFQKQLVFDAVPLTEELVEEYADEMFVDASQIEGETPRDRIASVFELARTATTRVSERTVLNPDAEADRDLSTRNASLEKESKYSKAVETLRESQLAIVDQYVQTNKVTDEIAKHVKASVESEILSRKYVVQTLDRYAAEIREHRKALREQEYIQSVTSADGTGMDMLKGDMPIDVFDNPPVEKVARVTETQRTAFRTKVAQFLNQGKSLSKFRKWLKNSYPTMLLRDQKDYLSEKVGEAEALGNHYIDPRPYVSCTDGAQATRKASAKYVQEMDKCASCKWRTVENDCSVYKRPVVSASEMPAYEAPQPIKVASNTHVEVDPSLKFDLQAKVEVEISEPIQVEKATILFDPQMP
tara:strand:+ start:8909 stop:10522 length:1614 start_codon:yes stop_codon:yes gene_type:complete